MKPINFHGANMKYAAPANWDEDKFGPCADLYVLQDEATQTNNSVWCPNAKELELLNKGHGIIMVICGRQPPVNLEVTIDPIAQMIVLEPPKQTIIT